MVQLQACEPNFASGSSFVPHRHPYVYKLSLILEQFEEVMLWSSEEYFAFQFLTPTKQQQVGGIKFLAI